MKISILIVSIILSQCVLAATKTASVTGNWNNTATWGGAAVPGATDDIVINTGITVTMTADYTTSATLTLNGTGTIQMAGYNLTVGSLTASGSAVINNGGTAKTLTVGSANTSTTYTGTLTNAINLVKTGSGTFTFSPSGTLSFRNVDVTAGTLDITSGTITLSAEIEHGNRLRANGGTLTLSGGSIDALGGYVVAGFGANGTINFTGCNVTADALMVGWNGIGTVTVSAGTLDFWWQIRHYDGGTGTVTINGGTVIAGDVLNTTGAGNTNTDYLTININSGGTLQANRIYITAEQDNDGDANNTPPHTTNINLNGGTLKAGGTYDLFGVNSHASGSATGQVYVNLLANSYIHTNGYTATLLVAINDAAGTYGITKQGTGTLVYAVNNTYDGATTISTGTLQIGNGSTTGSIASTSIVNNATLTYNRSDNITISAVISGTGGLTKEAANTLTLSGANSYTGATTVNAGTLKLGAANVISNSSALTVATGAVFDMNTYSETVGSIAGAGTIDNVSGGGTPVLTCGNNSASTEFSGVIQGSLSIVKNGTYALILSGTNTFSGGFTINAGTIRFGSASALGSTSGTFTINAGASINTSGGSINLNAYPIVINGSFTFTGTNSLNLGSGSVTLNSSPTITCNGSTFTIGGVISGGYSIEKTGAGTLVFSGANTYSGGTTTITAGTLRLGASGVIPDASAVTVASGATLDMRGYSETVGSIAGAGTITNGSGTGTYTLTCGGDNTNTIFSGNITNTSGTIAITKAGSGTLTLSGTNSYSGTMTISAGTLKLGSSTALSSTAPLALSGTGVLDLNTFSNSITNISSSVNTATITDNAAGAGTSTLTISAFTTIIACLILDGATRIIAIKVANANTSNPLFTLTNANTFSGGLTLMNNATGSRLRVSGALSNVGTAGAITSSPFGRSTIYVGESATDKAGILFDTYASNTLLNPIVFNTYLGTDEPGFRIETTSLTLAGTITANLSNAFFFASGTGSITITGQITGTNGLELNTYSGGNLTITVNNSGTANNYSGSTIIGNSGCTLKLASAAQIPDASAVTITGTLDMNTFSETVGSIAGAGTIDNVSGGGNPVLTCGGNNSSTSFTGTILNTSSAIALIKTGSGTLSLNTGTFTIKYLDLQQGTIGISSGTFNFTSHKGNQQAINIIGNSILNISGGTLSSADYRLVAGFGGSDGTLNISGGTINFEYLVVGWNSAGTVNISGGTSTFDNSIIHNDAGNGSVLTLTGGTVTTPLVRNNSNGTGTDNLTINLNAGGSLTTTSISAYATSASGTHYTTLNLAGGTLTASGTGNIFATPSGGAATNNLYIYDNTGGPTTINTNGYTCTAQVPILAGTGGGITKSGTGTLIYSAANTYTTTTTVSAGTLQLGAAEVINDGSAVSVSAGAILDMNTFSETVGSIAGAGTINNASGGGTPVLTSGGNNTSTTFSGIIQNSSGSLAISKTGTGTLTLSGANTFTGITSILNGIITIGHTSALGSIAAGTTISSGAALNLNGITYSNAEALSLVGTGYSSSGVVYNSSATPASFAGAITLTGESTITANNQITLSGNITNNQHFTKTGSNSLIFANNTVTVNNLTISAGTLDGATSTVNIYGDFTSAGTFIPNANGVVMLGSGVQTIPAVSFNNLTINNAAGVILGGNISVSGTLTLTDGILNTDSYYIDLGANGSIVEATPSATAPTSYVTGTIKATRNTGSTSGTVNFGGIGIEITETTKTDNSTVVIRVTGTTCTGIEGNQSIKRYFTIEPVIDAGLNATLVFSYFDHEITGHTEPNLMIYKSTDSRVTWSPVATSRDAALNTLTATDISSFSDWTASDGINAPLPIELIEFNAFATDGKIEIEWTTASEKNNDYFTIERSIDGITWVSITNIQGAGNSTNMLEYSYVDYEYFASIVYYRLKQTDYDGTQTYSQVISIDSQLFDTTTICIYNRTSHVLTCNCSEKQLKQTTSIEIISSNGQRVMILPKYQQHISLEHLPKGIYYIYISLSKSYISQRIVID